ncbi:MAG: MFS transporter [Chloroflexi bacterium]|nr:MFS transporter [Chloroflexota bacterium]
MTDSLAVSPDTQTKGAAPSEQLDAQAQALGLGAVLKIRNFRHLVLGHLVSNFGNSLTALALFILIHDLTGTVSALATLTIIIALPEVIFGLISGVYVDRFDRRRIMMLADSGRAVVVLGFILVGSRDWLWLAFVFAFLEACIGAFYNPARSALIPNLVPENGLMSANALVQLSGIVVQVLGTATAGIIIALTGAFWPAFGLDALTFVASVWFISRIQMQARAAQPAPAAAADGPNAWREMKEGLRAIVRSRVLFGTLAVSTVAMLGIGAFNILNVPLLIDILAVPETWFAVVQFALVAGLIVGGGALTSVANRLHPARLIGLFLGLMGVGVLLTGAVTGAWQLMLLLFALGACLTPLEAAITTMTQTAVRDEMRGRVSSARNMLVQMANLVSMACAGLLADLIGVRETLGVGGAIVVAAALSALWVFRDYSPQPESDSAPAPETPVPMQPQPAE